MFTCSSIRKCILSQSKWRGLKNFSGDIAPKPPSFLFLGISLVQSYSVHHLPTFKRASLKRTVRCNLCWLQWRQPRGEGTVAPNNFRIAKCDSVFISSSSQEAIKNKVQASIVASNYFSKLYRTGIRQHIGWVSIPVA